MNRPEILSPAGNLTKLKIAIAYGADAVYASMGSFSLRQRSAKEFNSESFKEGVDFAHLYGKKLYATVNGFPFNMQLDGLKRHIKILAEFGVDGFIAATPAVIALLKEIAPKAEIHLSTQANVTNWLDAKIYYEMGVSRIVAAREMSLKDIVYLKEKLPSLEIEIFCHGSMCFAYSGRCLVSAVQSGRFSNRGSCANDCRFNYQIYAKNEESGALFRLEEQDGEGTYIMNSKDLNLAKHIEKILSTNAVSSLKIEGRTKSEYYVACTTRAYKMAVEDMLNGKFSPEIYENELNTLKNRGFTDGYLVHRPFEREDTQNLDSSLDEGTHQVHAMSEDGEVFKTKFLILPDTIYEIMSPLGRQIEICDNEIGEIILQNGKYFVKFKKLITKTGKNFSEIHSGNEHEILLPAKLPEFSFLRKEI